MLELDNVSAQYGETKVLFDVSIRVEKDQIVSIIGSNGAGKSTLLSIISGLLKPTYGHVRFEGAEITGFPPHEIVEMGAVLVPEGKMLFSKMSVEENLLVGSVCKRSKASRDRQLKKVFEIFPLLHERMSQLAGSLSGGEQQMLAIARGLMADPRLFILDEPSLGLAPILKIQIFHSLSSLKMRGLTMLLVDQNLVQTLEMSDYAYILVNGRITLEGSREKLMSDENIRRSYIGL